MSNGKIPQVGSETGSETPISAPVASIYHHSVADDDSDNFIRMLLRRRIWIIGSIVVCSLVALILTLKMKPVYQASITIELNKSGGGSQSFGLADEFSQQAQGGDLTTDLQTESQVLMGNSLALAVIQRLGLASTPEYQFKGGNDPEKGVPLEDAPKTRTRLLRIFEGGLKVRPVGGTRLIHVMYESQDPKQAAQIANTLIDSYKNQYLRSHYDATSETSGWLTEQLSELKGNVLASEQKLTAFEKESGILSLSMTSPESSGNGGAIHSVVIQKLDALNAELTAAESNRIEKEAIYRIVQTGNGDAIIGLVNDPLAVQSKSQVLTQGGGLSNLDQLRHQQNQMKMDLAEASTTYGTNNRHIKDMEITLLAMDDQIRQELQEIVKRARGDYELARKTEEEVHRRFDLQQDEASKLNDKAVQFEALSQEADSRKKLYDDLYTKLQEANVAAGIKATNISIVDPARPPSIPIRPRPKMYLALGILVGIIVGFGCAYSAEILDRTVDNPLLVEGITGKPVIAVIPNFGPSAMAYGGRAAYEARLLKKRGEAGAKAAGFEKSLWILRHPESVAAEAFRSLRTAILLSGTGGGPKVILVTSCIPGEGKTTVVSNLAAAFAQHGKKVLIIDADMRRPRVRELLGVANNIGLSNVLAGSVRSVEAIQCGIQVPTLDILASGIRPPMPSEMLGSRAFDELLQELRGRYDVILIDSPPALLVTDPVSIGTKADAAVWVARAGVVTKQNLARAAQLIERNRMPVIGFVVNGMNRNMDSYGYGYSYGYRYGYRYGSNDAYYSEENRNDA